MSRRGSARAHRAVRDQEAAATVAGVRGPRWTRFHRAALAKVPLPLRGLRSRLVVAFVLVTMAGALSTGAVTFREARTGVLQQSQDTVIRQFRAGVNDLAVNTPCSRTSRTWRPR